MEKEIPERLAIVETEIKVLTNSIDTLNETVKPIAEWMQQNKGAKAILNIIGSVFLMALGAIISKIIGSSVWERFY